MHRVDLRGAQGKGRIRSRRQYPRRAQATIGFSILAERFIGTMRPMRGLSGADPE